MAGSKGDRGRRPPTRRGTVPVAVAAATAGVTGFTLLWAGRTAPVAPAATTATSTAPKTEATAGAQHMAADEAAIARLRQTIASTEQQIAALDAPVTLPTAPPVTAPPTAAPAGGASAAPAPAPPSPPATSPPPPPTTAPPVQATTGASAARP